MDAAVDFAAEQAGRFENSKMLRNRGERNVERSGELGNRSFALGETREDGAAGGIGKGAESGVQDASRIVNHTV